MAKHALILPVHGYAERMMRRQRSSKVRFPWVAEIGDSGRRFLRGDLDFREADRMGRGVRVVFILREGSLYEVCQPDHFHDFRYFGRMDSEGNFAAMPKAEAMEALA